MKRIIIVVFLLSLTAVIFCETIAVDYIDGKVEVLSNSKWTKIVSGDSLDTNSSIRLADGSLMEFEYNGSRISIVEGGTYNIKNLISSAKEVKSWGLLDIVGKKIEKTLSTDAASSSAALGVRGDETGLENIDWVLDESDADKVELARAYIVDEKYGDAISVLESYSDTAQADEMKQIRYYLAYARAMQGETAAALMDINKSGMAKEDPLYPDYVLLKGKLLLEGLSYKKALSLFDEYLVDAPQGPSAQTVLILESFCYKGTGDKSKQKESLSKAEKLDPASAEGKQARRLLDTLK